jgi:hypothetical protein
MAPSRKFFAIDSATDEPATFPPQSGLVALIFHLLLQDQEFCKR